MTFITVRFGSGEDSDVEISENEMQSLGEKGKKKKKGVMMNLWIMNLFNFSEIMKFHIAVLLDCFTLDAFETDEYDDVLNAENPEDDNQTKGELLSN